MKRIIKTVPPKEFIEFCSTPGVSFSCLGGVAKRALKDRLLEDQGYICCYCGCRIHNDEKTKIEHIKCQKHYKELDLCFDNMLVSCDGGDKDRNNNVTPRHHCHCDAKKGDNDIPISPLDVNIEAQFLYFDDGTVEGCTNEGRELIQILGLNIPYLVNIRKNIWKIYDGYSKDELLKELEYVNEKHGGKYVEYCFVSEQYINFLLESKTNREEVEESPEEEFTAL